MQPLSPNTSQIHGGRECIGTDSKLDEAGRGAVRQGREARWAGASGSPWEPGPRALLSFRGAGFLQPGPTSEEKSPRSELSGVSGSPQPCQIPLLSLARAQAGAPSWGLCVSDVLAA